VISMRNLHRLEPCSFCSIRMAVPGDVCTMCDAFALADIVPQYVSSIALQPQLRGRLTADTDG
jgi:hypothetical protein